MSIEKKDMYHLGVDIGGTKIWFYLTDEQGEFIQEIKVDTSSEVNTIAYLIKEFISTSGVSIDQIAFISCGVPGATDSDKGIVFDAPALSWDHIHFTKALNEYFPCPVYVENDVNCAAIGEGWKGLARGCDNYIYLSIGTGVGGAIVINGDLVRGHSYMAGEVAYLISDEDIEKGNHNTFGEFGTFESKVSGTALCRTGSDPIQIFKDYYNDVGKAKKVISKFEKLLALNIANIVSLLNPEKVIISGGVAQSMAGLLTGINDHVKRYTPIPTSIVLSSLGEASAAVGAVAIGMKRYYGDQKIGD